MNTSRNIPLATLIAWSLGGVRISHRAIGHQATAPAPTSAATHLVPTGFGDRGGAANIFAQQVAEDCAGDTVTWTRGGALEPHTISFGPQALMEKLAAGILAPVSQKGTGPPLMDTHSRIAMTLDVAVFAQVAQQSCCPLDRKKCEECTDEMTRHAHS